MTSQSLSCLWSRERLYCCKSKLCKNEQCKNSPESLTCYDVCALINYNLVYCLRIMQLSIMNVTNITNSQHHLKALHCFAWLKWATSLWAGLYSNIKTEMVHWCILLIKYKTIYKLKTSIVKLNILYVNKYMLEIHKQKQWTIHIYFCEKKSINKNKNKKSVGKCM